MAKRKVKPVPVVPVPPGVVELPKAEAALVARMKPRGLQQVRDLLAQVVMEQAVDAGEVLHRISQDPTTPPAVRVMAAKAILDQGAALAKAPAIIQTNVQVNSVGTDQHALTEAEVLDLARRAEVRLPANLERLAEGLARGELVPPLEVRQSET